MVPGIAMPNATIIFRKVYHLPIYYRIDWGKGIILSIKAWETRRPSWDVFPLRREFAENIDRLYLPISESRFQAVKQRIMQPISPGRARQEFTSSPAPGLTRNSENWDHLHKPNQFDRDDPG